METKIFISHRSKDVEYATAIVDFLEDLGVASKSIVCTSVPDHLIPNGKKIYDWLREQFLSYNLHMLFLLSDNYYESPDCLNEMGAAWVTKADSDVFLLPGFSADKMRGCIGKELMAIACDCDENILKDRVRQLRDKVCNEFGLSIPEDRRWERIQTALLQQIRKEGKASPEILKRNLFPEFNIQILALDKQLPGTIEPINQRGLLQSIPHKNVQYAIKQINDAIIRNLKIFGRSMDAVETNGNTCLVSVCYMESPDTQWKTPVIVLSRDIYPAGSDGIPKMISIEYTMDKDMYRQDFYLDDDRKYNPMPVTKVQPPDLEKTIQTKSKMREVFLRNPAEMPEYPIQPGQTSKLKERDAIVMSKACQDPEWNTDGGFGRYELYDLCDEGILFWDPYCETAEVEFYLRNSLIKTKARRLLCLKYEDIVTCDEEGNSGYNIPILYTKYDLGENPFKYYYYDENLYGMISNSVITSVKNRIS